MDRILAIDVSSRSLETCHLDGRGHLVSGQCPNCEGPIQALIQQAKHNGWWIVVEATGCYHLELVLAAQSAGVKISVLNPASVRKFAACMGYRSKTDPLDARVILRYAQARQSDSRLSPLPPIDLNQLLLRKLLGQRELLVGQRTAMAQAGLHKDFLASVDREIKRLEKEIASLCLLRQDLYVRFQEIPFVGTIGAAHLLAVLWTPSLFGSARQLIAFAGLDVVLHESGRYKGKCKLSKKGWPSLRRVLAAGLKGASCIRCKASPLRDMMLQYRTRSKNPLPWAGAASAVSRKILATAWSMATHGTSYEPSRVQSRSPKSP